MSASSNLGPCWRGSLGKARTFTLQGLRGAFSLSDSKGGRGDAARVIPFACSQSTVEHKPHHIEPPPPPAAEGLPALLPHSFSVSYSCQNGSFAVGGLLTEPVL